MLLTQRSGVRGTYPVGSSVRSVPSKEPSSSRRAPPSHRTGGSRVSWSMTRRGPTCNPCCSRLPLTAKNFRPPRLPVFSECESLIEKCGRCCTQTSIAQTHTLYLSFKLVSSASQRQLENAAPEDMCCSSGVGPIFCARLFWWCSLFLFM